MPETFTLDPSTDIRNQHGAPGWHELVTPDPRAAEAFLASTYGWEVVEYEPMPGYKVARLHGHGIGGIREPMAGEDAAPHWVTYVAVDDADDVVERARASGAQVVMPATDMAEVGRMAIVAHPATGPLYFMTHTQPFG